MSRRPSPIIVSHLFSVQMLSLLMLGGAVVAGQHAGISIIPPGPAVGFSEETSFNITCTSNRQGNVTWALPIASDELDNFNNKGIYDLPKRTQIASYREGDLFIVVLTINKAKKSDTGRYTCHPNGVDILSASQFFPSIYIFISWKGVVGVELNPMKSVYVVSSSQPLFVVPCFNHFPSHYFSLVDLVLQKKKLTPSSISTLWESVDLSSKTYLNWSFSDYKGIAIRNPKSGEYRCGAAKFNGTCSSPKWSLYSFFIVEETGDKDMPDDDKDQQPRIRPTALPFLVFSAGSTFSLMCRTGAAAAHQWNVNWRLPSTYQNDDYESAKVKSLGQRVVATLAKGNGKSSHSDYSVLTISNASHLDTGYYTCHRADNETILAKQYVFIKDWGALITAPLNRNVEFGKTEIAIGCRPTHPSVQLSLNRITDDGTPVTMYPSNKTSGEWSFDLFTGFKMMKKISWDTEGTYQCVGRKNYVEGPSKQRSAVMTHDFYIGVRGIELKQTLNNNSRQVLQGDAVTLTCREKKFPPDDSDANSFSNVTWHWTRAVGNKSVAVEFGENINLHLAPPGVKIVAQKLSGFTVSHLNWHNISTGAAGTFKCSNKQIGVSSPLLLTISSANGIQRKNSVNSLICGKDSLFTTEGIWFLSVMLLVLVIY